MITKDTNNKIIEFFKKYAWSVWIGFILGSCGIYANDYRFWIFLIPLILLIQMSKKSYFKSIMVDYQENIDREEERKRIEKEEKEKLDFFR